VGTVIRGHPLVPGEADGEILGSNEPLSFWGGYDAATGRIIDRRHALSGQNAAGRILVIPSTRGSSTTTAILLEAIRRETAPAAILTSGPDRFLVLAAIVADELYGRSLPVVALDPADFEAASAAGSATVERDGTVRLVTVRAGGGRALET
jgi:predicted aconitase with swiveling domain